MCRVKHLGCYLEGQGHSMTLQQNRVWPKTLLFEVRFYNYFWQTTSLCPIPIWGALRGSDRLLFFLLPHVPKPIRRLYTGYHLSITYLVLSTVKQIRCCHKTSYPLKTFAGSPDYSSVCLCDLFQSCFRTPCVPRSQTWAYWTWNRSTTWLPRWCRYPACMRTLLQGGTPCPRAAPTTNTCFTWSWPLIWSRYAEHSHS